jgi:hypothetical protein
MSPSCSAGFAKYRAFGMYNIAKGLHSLPCLSADMLAKLIGRMALTMNLEELARETLAAIDGRAHLSRPLDRASVARAIQIEPKQTRADSAWLGVRVSYGSYFFCCIVTGEVVYPCACEEYYMRIYHRCQARPAFEGYTAVRSMAPGGKGKSWSSSSQRIMTPAVRSAAVLSGPTLYGQGCTWHVRAQVSHRPAADMHSTLASRCKVTTACVYTLLIRLLHSRITCYSSAGHQPHLPTSCAACLAITPSLHMVHVSSFYQAPQHVCSLSRQAISAPTALKCAAQQPVGACCAT